MTSVAAVMKETRPRLAPFSLKDAPSFIEVQFPVGRLSAEAYKERKAGAGQTLTALGSYWKGRKPLILVRAVVLGTLLPISNDPAKDLEIFLKLMAMDDVAFARRFDGSANEFARLFPAWAELVTEETGRRRIWRTDLCDRDREAQVAEAFASLSYSYDQRLKHVRRPEECDEKELLAGIWPEVNRHLGTDADSIPELVTQLGIARFGHRTKLSDTFCGGGSIPFEAARMGCDVYASDLDPIACMLTWGAFNIIGASPERRAKIDQAQKEIAALVYDEITHLGIEHDKDGNRAKSYLYCLETRCPKTGWMVPLAPSWVISKTGNVVAKLVPDHVAKRYLIEVHSGVSAAEMSAAEGGTVRDGRLVHPMNPERSGVEIKTIRGDYRDAQGANHNRLRLWEKSDFIPRPDDIWQERLYAIQWIAKETLNESRRDTFFAAVTENDLARERKVEDIVRQNLGHWQQAGFVPDTPIEPGEKTDEPIRTRGWTHWHHLFGARHILIFATLRRQISSRPEMFPFFCRTLNLGSRLCLYNPTGGNVGREPKIDHVFLNQAFNVMFNYGVRSANYLIDSGQVSIPLTGSVVNDVHIDTLDASSTVENVDFFLTDPPYADAIVYHEIAEYFIAWLRKDPPPPFDQWIWDSRRGLAIKGKDEAFRREMVAAYSAMTRHMPDNGVHIVMFTHQDADVWADLGTILWAAGLRVAAAWNIVTETIGALKEGNYIQGTVCLVLRKRLTEANARRMEIEAEIEAAGRASLGA